MRNKGTRTGNRYNARPEFELLEGRRMLAADVASACAFEPIEVEVIPCIVASADYPAEVEEGIIDMNDSSPGELGVEVIADDIEPALDEAADNSGSETDTSLDVEPNQPDPRQLDLADGMDGYFGSINAEQPQQTLSFTTASDGMVDVVIASSFGEAETSVTVNDSEGMMLESSVEGLDGFNVLTFEAKEGEAYEVTIGSDVETEGQFQATVGFEAFVDQHADEISEASSEIVMIDSSAELEGRLESSGDVDTFRFTPDESGEVMLGLDETMSDARIGLNVSVFDSQANLIAEGQTNESLLSSFDAEAGNEYLIEVSANDSKGTYRISLNLEPSEEPSDPVIEVSDDTTDVSPVDVDSESPENSNVEEEVGDEAIAQNDASDEAKNTLDEPDVSADELPDSELTLDTPVVDAAVDQPVVEDDAKPDCEIDESVAEPLDSADEFSESAGINVLPAIEAPIEMDLQTGDLPELDGGLTDTMEDFDEPALENGNQDEQSELVEELAEPALVVATDEDSVVCDIEVDLDRVDDIFSAIGEEALGPDLSGGRFGLFPRFIRTLRF